MENTSNEKNKFISNDTISSYFKFYKFGTILIIYDNFFQLPFTFLNGKPKDMDRRTFEDYADEVEDPKEIELLFKDEMKQELIKVLKRLREHYPD